MTSRVGFSLESMKTCCDRSFESALFKSKFVLKFEQSNRHWQTGFARASREAAGSRGEQRVVLVARAGPSRNGA